MELMHINSAKRTLTHLMIRKCSRHALPKCWGMIEFNEVTELVHNNVVHELLREECNTVVEIEIFLHRTTSPPRTLVTYCNFVVCAIIKCIPVRETLVYEYARTFLMLIVVGSMETYPSSPWATTDKSLPHTKPPNPHTTSMNRVSSRDE